MPPLAAKRLLLRASCVGARASAQAQAGCVLPSPAQRTLSQPSMAQHGDAPITHRLLHLLLPSPALPLLHLPAPLQVLIADFFFILFALGWLGAGLAERSALQSTVSPCLPALPAGLPTAALPPTHPTCLSACRPAESVAVPASLRSPAHCTALRVPSRSHPGAPHLASTHTRCPGPLA